ncbi:response regulator [Pendulispora rubella]|uniref:response regulator n=1 Tax=Pendulispora rubella TaxID=2741070 RepID=UPI00374E0FD2
MPFAFALKRAGFRVTQAGDGEEALNRAFEEVPDVVVTDLRLPVMDGWQLIRGLRGDQRTGHVRIAVLTGMGATAVDGADVVLVKPYSPLDLASQVRNLLIGSSTRGPFALP